MGDGPLSGVRVADFTTNMSGPFATMALGDQGADVIKVEPPEGDVIRTIGTHRAGLSAYFANLNRSKRMLCLDLNREKSKVVIDALLDSVDVVAMNYRPGVATRLGLDAEQVRSDRPKIVHAEIVGYGDVGPFAGRPAYDHVVQAMAGFAATQIDRSSGEPSLIKQGIVDKVTGLALAQAITAALLGRARTGVGTTLQLRMIDVAISFLWPDAMMNFTIEAPEVTLPSIANSFRLTKTSDGHIAFMVVTERQWKQVLATMKIDDEGRMATPADRMRNGGEFVRKIVSHLSGRTTAQAVDLLASADVPVAPVVDLEHLHEHPQVQASRAVDAFDHPILGPIRQANPIVPFGGTASGLRAAAALGGHNHDVLAELGFGAEAIEDLEIDGAVVGPRPLRSTPS